MLPRFPQSVIVGMWTIAAKRSYPHGRPFQSSSCLRRIFRNLLIMTSQRIWRANSIESPLVTRMVRPTSNDSGAVRRNALVWKGSSKALAISTLGPSTQPTWGKVSSFVWAATDLTFRRSVQMAKSCAIHLFPTTSHRMNLTWPRPGNSWR